MQLSGKQFKRPNSVCAAANPAYGGVPARGGGRVFIIVMFKERT